MRDRVDHAPDFDRLPQSCALSATSLNERLRMTVLDPYDAVMLLSYGGPNGPDDVLPFMRNATRGRGIPDSRLLEVSEHYQRFQGVSPINAWNRRLIEDLRGELRRRGCDIPVGWGNRNWHPFVDEGLAELADAGARRILVLPTSAYASYSGCRQYREDLERALASFEGRYGDAVLGAESSADNPDAALIVDKIRPFYNTRGMVTAQVRTILAAYRKLADQGVDPKGVRLIFVTHSIPLGMEEGSAPSEDERSAFCDLSMEISYVAQHRALIRTILPFVRKDVGIPDLPFELAFCSRSGPPHVPWLEPDINDLLRELADLPYERLAGLAAPAETRTATDTQSTAAWPSNVRPTGVVVAPVGFIYDHMEVVYDLDTEARETAADVGLPYERAATVSTDRDFVASLVDVLQERAAQARGERIRPDSATGTGPFHTVCPEQCCRPGNRRPHPHPS